MTKSIFAFGFMILSSTSSWAAPIPGMGSSKLIAPELGIFRSANGFQISAGGSGWIHVEAPSSNKFIETVYQAPELEPAIAEALAAPVDKGQGKKALPAGEAAALTVRVDKLEKDISVERYAQRWLKEYPKYGFDLIASKAFAHTPVGAKTNTKIRGYLLDLVNRDSNRQLRQVIFVKNRRAVILTCRDDLVSFQDSIKGCNQIIRTFNWTE